LFFLHAFIPAGQLCRSLWRVVFEPVVNGLKENLSLMPHKHPKGCQLLALQHVHVRPIFASIIKSIASLT
jgi:hypothetical protein